MFRILRSFICGQYASHMPANGVISRRRRPSTSGQVTGVSDIPNVYSMRAFGRSLGRPIAVPIESPAAKNRARFSSILQVQLPQRAEVGVSTRTVAFVKWTSMQIL